MKYILLIVALVLIAFSVFTYVIMGPTGKDSSKQTVRISSDSNDTAALELQQAGLVKSFTIFSLALSIKNPSGKIEPGGYYFSKNMNAWQIINHLKQGPDLKEVLIREGLRKEQIGEILKSALGWSEQQRIDWDQIHSHDDYFEGVYFPDTYLIPVKDTPEQVAQRMIDNFNQKFASYQDNFAAKNEQWTTGLKIASIIQREAAGSEDMPLISGILWNRLLANQPLQIDATVQYALGGPGDWWPTLNGTDTKNTDSQYNTYQHSGLPPTPISNPGLAAIEAALNPQDTDCFYYLHSKRQIYCAKTYEEHLKNIDKYLK